MKLIHVSDKHGTIGAPLSTACTTVVHSGDFCPNRTFGVTPVEEAFQAVWIETNAKALRGWIGERTLLMCSGNHDYIDAAFHLRGIGIDAVNLDDRKYHHRGVTFAGFPWSPQFGDWNFMCGDTELRLRVNEIDLEGVDVLVAHSPIYGVLDRNDRGTRCGNAYMRKRLRDHTGLKWYLHGHIHEAAGVAGWIRGLKVSNAACTEREICVS